MSTNYILACYMGPRCNEDPRYTADRAFFMKEHVASLERLKHELGQITIVCSGGDPTGYLATLPKTLGGAPVEIIHRENVGLSYGGYSDAFERYRSAFSHYIFNEDDYVFTHPRFDGLLLEELSKRPGCGMLCGTAIGIPRSEPQTRHAAVFIGICPTAALTKARTNVFSSIERLPHGENAANSAIAERMGDGYFGQKAVSFAIETAGYDIEDWLLRWSTAYWNSEPGIVRWFNRSEECANPLCLLGDLSKPSLVVPIQALDVPVRLSDSSVWHYGTLDRCGVWT